MEKLQASVVGLPAITTGGPSADSASRLLSLPAELRAEIFALVLANVRCMRPIVIWDDVCLSVSGRKKPVSTAILHACRMTYDDCLPILYDNTTVEVSIRSDSQDQSFPRFQMCLGPIEGCALLSRLRHIELEVSYRCREDKIARVSHRIRAFADVCRKLKTADLTFFDESPRRTSSVPTADPMDPILAASMSLECERFLSIARNYRARSNMDSTQWLALRSKLQGFVEDGRERQEEFREISFDYFEHAFRQKN